MTTYPTGKEIEYTDELERIAIKIDLPDDKTLGYSPDITDAKRQYDLEMEIQKQLFE